MIWYLAFCVQCNGGIDKLIAGDKSVLPMPFAEKAERTTWVDAHMDGTDHAILLMNQHDSTTQRPSDDRKPPVHQTS